MIRIGNAKISDKVKFDIADSATCIIEDDVEIRDFVVIESGDNGYIHICKGTIINSNCWINASGKVLIGKNVLIAPNVAITSSSHRHDLCYNIKDQGMKISDVTIEDNVWVGAGVAILPGVKIDNSSIIAANSVVKFNVERESIMAGSPAKKVADRKYKTVVFYTLPLVIRDKPTLFSSIVDVYIPLVRAFQRMGWKCIFVGTDELSLEYNEFEWITPKSFDANYPTWESHNWLESWKKILTSKNLSFHNEFLDQMLLKASPSLVFCWNFDGLLKQKMAKLNVPILFNELGLLRSPNPMVYYSDPIGVNTSSGLKEEFNSYLEIVESAVASDSDRLKVIEKNYSSKGIPSEPYVLVLLQVQDDSNIIMGSPFASMWDYVDCVLSAINSSDFKVVVKPHPLDEKPKLPNNVVVADNNANTSLLIAESSAVFTINSSAGFEAALAGKAVYVLGEAPYSNLGITIDIEKPEVLSTLWGKYTVTPPSSRELRSNVLSFIYDKYFLTPEQFVDPSAHFSRLIGISDGNKKRNDFINEYEINRQQAYISFLRKENTALEETQVKLLEEQKYSETLRAELLEVKGLLFLTKASLSWRITRPLRAIRMLFLDPKFVLRRLYQKIPFLNRIMLRARFLRHYIHSCLDAKNNLLAIQMLSNRRNVLSGAPIYEELPIIAISIVTFNSSKWVDTFFDSLLKQSYPLNKINLIVVDNGSSDNTVSLLEVHNKKSGNYFAGFNIISGDNVGFGAGHHTAIDFSNEKLILISNIDLTFTHDALKIVVLETQLDTLNEVASWELRQAPYEHPKYYDPVSLETNWSSHACILIRKKAYLDVNGYDKGIFMYGEDVELSYRFRSFGYHLKYCPSALVFHYTYEHENQVKPLQYKGSTLANFNIRLRYGDIWDKVAIVFLQLGLFLRPKPYTNARKDLLKNILVFIKSAPNFLKGKGCKKKVFFPFRKFDYEMIREGAFWEIGSEIEEKPLVSVIVRTYKGRDVFLKQAIQSISNQTYFNIEVIVVEDGGDTHEELVKGFVTKNGIILRYFNLNKVGRSVTGNYGLSQAKGKYCVFLDDDDLLFSDHVEVLLTALVKNKNAVAAYSLAMEVSTRMLSNDRRYEETFFNTPNSFKQEYDYSILEDHNFIPIQSILFKRSLYIERGGFEEDMDNLEDWNLWLRYGYKNTFIYIPKTTSLFRTPADIKVKQSRHENLHQAYDIAKNRAKESCKNIII